MRKLEKLYFQKKKGLLNNYNELRRVLFLKNIHKENERILEQVGIAVQGFKESKIEQNKGNLWSKYKYMEPKCSDSKNDRYPIN